MILIIFTQSTQQTATPSPSPTHRYSGVAIKVVITTNAKLVGWFYRPERMKKDVIL